MPRPKTLKEALCRELKGWAGALCADVAQEGGDRLGLSSSITIEIRGETKDTITFSMKDAALPTPRYFEVKVTEKWS